MSTRRTRLPSCSAGSTGSTAPPAASIRAAAIAAATATFSTEQARRTSDDRFTHHPPPWQGPHGGQGDAAVRRGRTADGVPARPADHRHQRSGSGRLPPAASDRHQGRRAHGGTVHRPLPRQPVPRATGRCGRLRTRLAARVHRRDHHRRAGRHRKRLCGKRRHGRSAVDSQPLRGPRRGDPDPALSACRSQDHGERQAALPEDDGASRTVRIVAGGHRSEQPQVPRKRPALEFRLRGAAQSRRHGGKPGRSRAAARRYAGLRRAPLDRPRQIPEGRVDQYPVRGQGQGQDQRRWQMIKFNLSPTQAEAESAEPAREQHIAPVPRISIQAFCETPETTATMQAAGEDRRMGKAHVKIQAGGIVAAVEAYRTSPTPNVVVIESCSQGDDLITGLDTLAEVCDAGTRVIVIGKLNDIVLYRELVRRGVSDYLMAPITVLDVVRSVSSLFSAPDARPVGRTIAVVGARGGVGASTVAHNVAFSIARDLQLDSVVADLDLPFGTAGLDYNQDPPQGIADAVFSPERIDTGFVDRLLAKCTDHLSLLAAPATLERVYDFGMDAFDPILDVL